MYGTPAETPIASKPLPRVTPFNEGFWENTRRGVFSIQTCNVCGDRHVPESPVCPKCLSKDQEWRPASGRGTLESWVDFHRAYWDGFTGHLPYRVCLVRLDEGALFVSNFVGADEEAQYGRRVKVVFDKVNDEITLPKFAPA